MVKGLTSTACADVIAYQLSATLQWMLYKESDTSLMHKLILVAHFLRLQSSSVYNFNQPNRAQTSHGGKFVAKLTADQHLRSGPAKP